jgi:hypothetical protein
MPRCSRTVGMRYILDGTYSGTNSWLSTGRGPMCRTDDTIPQDTPSINTCTSRGSTSTYMLIRDVLCLVTIQIQVPYLIQYTKPHRQQYIFLHIHKSTTPAPQPNSSKRVYNNVSMHTSNNIREPGSYYPKTLKNAHSPAPHSTGIVRLSSQPNTSSASLALAISPAATDMTPSAT